MFKKYVLAVAMACGVTTSGFASYDLSSVGASIPSGQVTIVDFWASWCSPCKASFAAYNTLKSKYPQIKIIGVNENKPEEKNLADAFLSQTPHSGIDIVWDKDGSVMKAYGVGNMPTAYLFDKSGNFHKKFAGFNSGSMKEMEDAIKEISK